mgnify:CR=1 FL=1
MQLSVELLAILVTIFGGAIAFVYGYGTLNAQVGAQKEAMGEQDKAHAKEISALTTRLNIIEKRHYDLDSHVARELSGVMQSLARIEGALGVKRD